MDSTRRISIATGTLFIVATVAAIAAPAVGPALSGPTYLAAVAEHSGGIAVSHDELEGKQKLGRRRRPRPRRRKLSLRTWTANGPRRHLGKLERLAA